MTPEDYLDAIRAESERILAVAGPALDQPIAHLGEWTARDLVAHVGRVYSMVIANTAVPASERASAGDAGNPPDGDRLSEWFAERRVSLLHQLENADPDGEYWTFAGPKPLEWWFRRMAHETAIHRWDAEAIMAEGPSPIDGDLAADGVDEFAEVHMRPSIERAYPEHTLHLHRTDGPGEWMFARSDDGRAVVTHEHGKGDAAIRASGSDLVLWIWGRPVTGLEIFGEPAVVDAWQNPGS